MKNTGALAELRQHPGRFAAVLTAITLSIAFIAAIQVFIGTENAGMAKQQALYVTNADVAVDVTPYDPEGNERVAEVADFNARVPTLDGVAAAEQVWLGFAVVSANDHNAQSSFTTLPREDSLRWVTVTDGRLPEKADEILLARGMAKDLGVGVGDTVQLAVAGEPEDYTVTGLHNEPGSFIHPAYLSAAFADAGSQGSGAWIIDAKPGATATLMDDLKALGRDVGLDSDQVTVRTANEVRQEAMDSLTSDTDVVTNMLLVFGAIALLVGAIIIATTFSILVAQRRRQVGLLRTVGASKAQVWRRFALEALALGLIGSLLGIALGAGIAALASWLLTGMIAYGLEIPWLRLAITLVVGVVVTLIAALSPIRKAMAIAPLEALRPVAGAGEERRGFVARAIVCGLFILAGAGLAVLSIRAGEGENPLLLGVGAGVLLTIGILFAAPLYIPVILRGLGALLAPLGPTAKLAAANSARNPKRAGATATALMLAVGLVVTLTVATESVKASSAAALDKAFAIEVAVTPGWEASEKPLPDDLGGKLAQVDGVAGVSELHGSLMKIQFPDNEGTYAVLGYPADESGLSFTEEPVAGVAFHDPQAFDPDDGWLTKGDKVTIAGPDGKATLELQPSRLAGGNLLISRADLATLDADAGVYALWARTDNPEDAADVAPRIQRVVKEAAPQADLSGALIQKAIIGQIMDMLLLVVVGLLGVACVIALIGIGNTLGLSVLERTRESALLRSLGLQAAGLRWMLLIEAVLLALAGTLVGLGAGVFFGWLGTRASMAEISDSTPVVLAIPWDRIAMVFAVALVAAVIASVLPGHKAAKAAPVEALADVG